MATPNDAPGRAGNSTLPSLPEITVEIPKSADRTNTEDTLTAITAVDDFSPATLAPERSFRHMHSRNPSASAQSTASSSNPFAGRSRAASEATLAPPSTSAGASTHTLESYLHDDALKADPGSEKDFAVLNNKFAFSPGQLNKMLNPKSLAAFIALGGLPGLETGLRTDVDAGLSVDETVLAGSVSFEEVTKQYRKARGISSTLPRPIEVRHVDVTDVGPAGTGARANGAFHDRKQVFSANVLPARKPKSFLKLVWEA
jgi:Ca2+-transporting ATPase